MQLICFNCGVLVLATRVGGIPDMITDGETGFILEEDSPEGIAEGVSRIMDNQNLTLIAGQAEKVVEKEYVYEAMVRKCTQSLAKLVSPYKQILMHSAGSGYRPLEAWYEGMCAGDLRPTINSYALT